MTKSKPGVDKNLQNVVEDLETPNLTAHTNQQLNQKNNDQRKGDFEHFSHKYYDTENQE